MQDRFDVINSKFMSIPITDNIPIENTAKVKVHKHRRQFEMYTTRSKN